MAAKHRGEAREEVEGGGGQEEGYELRGFDVHIEDLGDVVMDEAADEGTRDACGDSKGHGDGLGAQDFEGETGIIIIREGLVHGVLWGYEQKESGVVGAS